MKYLFSFCLLILCAGGPISPAAHAQQVRSQSDSLRARQLFVEGLTLAQIDRPEEALAAYQEAITLLPEEPAIFSAMADAYAVMDEPSMALLYAQQAAARAPENAYYQKQVEQLRALQQF